MFQWSQNTTGNTLVLHCHSLVCLQMFQDPRLRSWLKNRRTAEWTMDAVAAVCAFLKGRGDTRHLNGDVPADRLE